jgi:hypothetical protein
MPRVLATLLRMAPFVGGASALAVVGLVIARAVIPIDELRPSNAEVGNYLQALGTIYAVVAAFVVFVVWNQFNEARVQIDREASELVDMFRIGEGMPVRTRDALHDLLCRYADAVTADELAALSRRDRAAVERTGELVDEMWAVLHGCEAMTDCQRALHAEAMSRFNDLSDVRTARLTSAHVRIPLALRLLLYIGGVIIVGSMYLLAVDRFWVHAAITGALAAGVAHVIYIVEDLDNPFDGNWRVSGAAFDDARRWMARRRAAANEIAAPPAPVAA